MMVVVVPIFAWWCRRYGWPQTRSNRPPLERTNRCGNYSGCWINLCMFLWLTWLNALIVVGCDLIVVVVVFFFKWRRILFITRFCCWCCYFSYDDQSNLVGYDCKILMLMFFYSFWVFFFCLIRPRTKMKDVKKYNKWLIISMDACTLVCSMCVWYV